MNFTGRAFLPFSLSFEFASLVIKSGRESNLLPASRIRRSIWFEKKKKKKDENVGSYVDRRSRVISEEKCQKRENIFPAGYILVAIII